MSTLKAIEKTQLESIFRMGSGYVLNFSNQSFADFFSDFSINIYSEKYTKRGESKANLLRTFWTEEPDKLVGKIIEALLEFVILYNYSTENDSDFIKAKTIACRLLNKTIKNIEIETTEKDFLNREFGDISLVKLDMDPNLSSVLELRLKEITKCIKNDIPLACIFSIGSILEGILLNAASKSPQKFNQSNCCPKDKNNKPRIFSDWTLSQLIDVSHSIGLLKSDIKKFSHHLRGFRNYIHPHQQVLSKFRPDLHTAKICFQVLKAVIADLSEER